MKIELGTSNNEMLELGTIETQGIWRYYYLDRWEINEMCCKTKSLEKTLEVVGYKLQ